MLDETKITDNWNAFRELINSQFSDERKDRLNYMYDTLEDRIVLAPASNKEHFHNAFPGGYVDHILRVVDFSKQELELWKKNGAPIDFSEEELIFAAIHHDLGKIGDLEHDRYVPNESQWHREKMGLIYQFNPKMHHMSTSDRSYFLLQHFGVKISQLEFLAIKCADGMYDESNETYLRQSDPGKDIKSMIVLIIHHADIMASRVEQGYWRSSLLEDGPKVDVLSKEKPKPPKVTKDQKKLFEDLFK